jgi:hypothetical protein
MSEKKKNDIESPIEEITAETPVAKIEAINELQAGCVRERVKNWKKRVYYVVDQENGEVVADGFKDEKTCKEWIASGASQFDTPYVICYSVQSVAPITKVQKTILK